MRTPADRPPAVLSPGPEPAPGEPRDLPAAALDRLLHEPARLVIATLLYAVDRADFLFLLRESGLSKGNLSSHLAKLEAAGHVAIEKTFRGKIPLTICRLTDGGREALRRYREQLKRVVDTLPE